MSEKNAEQGEKIHINCPYCWTEFNNFEQIGSAIDYNHHLYRDFVVLPFENALSPPFYIDKEPFGDFQEIEKIRCAECNREYSIIFLPWGLYPELHCSDTTLNKDLLSESNCQLPQSSTYTENIPLLKIVSNWKFFVLFNFLVIFAVLGSFLTKDLIFAVSFGLFLCLEIVILLLINIFSNFFTQYNEIEKMPFLIHENYQKKKYFVLFKQNFFNDKILQKEISRTGNFFISIISFVLVIGYLYTFQSTILKFNNPVEAIGLFLLHTGVILFIVYFTIVFFMGILFISLSFKYLFFISTKIPLKINPWNEKKEFRKITRFWMYSLIFSFFLMVVVPVGLFLPTILKGLSTFGSSTERLGMISTTLVGSNFLFYFIEAGIILGMIILILLPFNENVNRRKTELIHMIKKEINSIRALKEPSYHDAINVPLLLEKEERINKISSVTWIEGAFTVLLNIILPVFFLVLSWVLR